MLAPKVRGLEEFSAYIDGIARNSRGVVTETITLYILGNDNRGLKHYPAYTDQKVKRRTFRLRGNWVSRGTGVQTRAENSLPYAWTAQGVGSPGWLTKSGYKKYNWRNVDVVISTNIKGAIREAEREMVRKKG